MESLMEFLCGHHLMIPAERLRYKADFTTSNLETSMIRDVRFRIPEVSCASAPRIILKT